MPWYCSLISASLSRDSSGRVAPVLAADELVQALGERLGEAVGESFDHDRAVVVVRRLEARDVLVDTDARQ